MAIVAVDRLGATPFAELAHGLGRLARHPAGRLRRSELEQGEIFGPVAGDEAAISATGPGAAELSLDDGDRKPRIGFLQADGGPESEEAAADDANIGGRVAEKPFDRDRPFGRQGLAKPEGV